MSSRRVAIVGLGGLFPGAANLSEFWDNITSATDCSTEVPDGRWVLDKDDVWSSELAADKVNSVRGCFIDEKTIGSPELDIDPALLGRLDPMFHILLHAGAQAWKDAQTDSLDKQRVGVIIGNIALPTDSSSALADEILGKAFETGLPGQSKNTEDKTERLNRYVAGLPAGILAKALGLGAGSYTLDAACASSLYALKYAVDELQAGRADAMLTGGLSRPDCLYTQMGFSALGAISKTGHCSPFDVKGDGLVVGEGAGILLLKRLDDALRDGDQIYATIAGIGLSNDINGNLMSPDSEGQLRAIRAAYQQAGWRPQDIDHIECHGTGTPVGDAEEFKSLLALWGENSNKQRCVLGSVKSNVGHLLTAAGSAGLIKTLLAMSHEQLPATANFAKPSEKIALDESPFTVLKDTQPWPLRAPDVSRKAAISAFGFGGINAHVLLEQWQEEQSTDATIETNTVSANENAEIAIIGMDAHFGPWKSLEAFKQRVLTDDNNDQPELPDNWWGVENPDGIKGFFVKEACIPVGRFRIPPAELKEMLPQQLLMLQVAANALANAGLEKISEAMRYQTGVFIGIGLDLNTTNFHFRWALLNHAREWTKAEGLDLSDDEFQTWVTALRDAAGPALNANRTMGALGGIVASRVARAFKLGGSSFTISDEEASGMRALEAGVRALQRGELTTAIVGAVDLAGDVRAALGQHDRRAYSRQGSNQSFEITSDGCLIGEGATALILKRLEDAERDGDQIIAVIKGLGAASAGGVELNHPAPSAYQFSLQRACDDAGIKPEDIGLIETHGSGLPEEDALEAGVLADVFSRASRKDETMTCAISAVKSSIGHTGAAGGLASIVTAALALKHQQLPALRNVKNPRSEIDSECLSATSKNRYWLRNRHQGERLAAVGSMSIDGNVVHAILQQAPDSQEKTEAITQLADVLFVCRADSTEQLISSLDELASQLQSYTDETLHERAGEWRKSIANGSLTLSIVSRSNEQLLQQILTAKQTLADDLSMASNGIYYSTEPLGETGKLAFVYPGSGNHFQGMGQDLACQWPDVLNRLDQENESLGGQFAEGIFWSRQLPEELSQKDVIFGQVWTGTFVSDVVSQFGIQADAIIGYSLGETAGLFSTRTWTSRDEMLQRISETDLFTRQLAGPCYAARKTWGISENESIDWAIGVVDRNADEVRLAVASYPHAYLLIVNTPTECVIGGEREAVKGLVSTLGCHYLPIEGVTTVHCEVANVVYEAYRNLHLFETNPPENVSFYSGVLGRAYDVTRNSAADSIVGQAIQPFDYTKVIESAYADGVRLFIEMGPGKSCTRMINNILKDRAHVARAVCVPHQDSVSNIVHLLAQLVAEHVPVELESLYRQTGLIPAEKPVAEIKVATGGKPFIVPRLPQKKTPEQTSNATTVTEWSGLTEAAQPANDTYLIEPMLAQMQRTEMAKAETQALFLKVSNGLTQTLGQALTMQMQLLQSGAQFDDQITNISIPSDTKVDSRVSEDNALFNREQCMEIAIGSIGKVLGAEFAEIDQHPTRVRLPDEPLMLVDRIVEINAEACSMTSGSIVTEHDVLTDGWYLDGGRIPTCIAVEAGQADLFLSGYLGIDHITKGQAVYRLLDAKITFHGPLPKPGKIIRYDIRIYEFFRQDETYLFRFGFEGTVDGKPLLTMTEGCAGFFTQAELDAGKGIVQTALEKRPMAGQRDSDWRDLVPMSVESYSDQQLGCLRQHNLSGCFGEAFAGLPITKPVGLPGGRMTLIHRIVALDPMGGRFSLGQITGEADIHPDDWFLTCHFSDDQVMPGTLMYECCLHTLRVYLLRMGWVGESDACVYEPVIGEVSQLKCRGQVLASTKKVQYEITLKTIGYRDDGTPYVLADALMYADGRAIVQMNNMSVQLTGLTRHGIEACWGSSTLSASIDSRLRGNDGDIGDDGGERSVFFDYESILAFSNGNPSDAFGERYRVFDRERKIARLPRPPYQFLDRITHIENCEQWQLAAGGVIEAEYDVPEDAWYFAEDRQTNMPFAVLLEIALQPCGWLAAYLGSALTSDTDLKFRNLGGKATQLLAVTAQTGTLTTRIKITSVSQSGGMIIQNFEMEMRSSQGIVYKGDTYFGFFTQQALAEQVGIRDARVFEPDSESKKRAQIFPYPQQAPYPDTMMHLMDDVTIFDPQGGPNGLGFIRGTTQVDPDAWFYAAHFYEDPVCPGSLGLESFIQLLKVVAMNRWQGGVDGTECSFQSLALGKQHNWIYRGQIIPTDQQVTVDVVITEFNDELKQITADGFLKVDERIIYQMTNFTLSIETD